LDGEGWLERQGTLIMELSPAQNSGPHTCWSGVVVSHTTSPITSFRELCFAADGWLKGSTHVSRLVHCQNVRAGATAKKASKVITFIEHFLEKYA
jgi:hypothetical protein